VKLNLGCGDYPIEGFENLDRRTGWRFETGLSDYADASIEAITISHALMYVPRENWQDVFTELARVLAPGGVLRITEDDTANPDSERYGGWHDAVSMTSPALILGELRRAGLKATRCEPGASSFTDTSLIQRWHGDPPKVFHVEGQKQKAAPKVTSKVYEPDAKRTDTIMDTVDEEFATKKKAPIA